MNNYPSKKNLKIDQRFNTDNLVVLINGKHILNNHLMNKKEYLNSKILKIEIDFKRITTKTVKGRTYYYIWNYQEGKYKSIGNQKKYELEGKRVKKEIKKLKEDYKKNVDKLNSFVVGVLGRNHLLVSKKNPVIIKLTNNKISVKEVWDLIKNYPSGSGFEAFQADN